MPRNPLPSSEVFEELFARVIAAGAPDLTMPDEIQLDHDAGEARLLWHERKLAVVIGV